MQGEIDTFDPRAGVGEIAGIDGVRYRFAVAEMGAAPAAMGVWVNFVAGADGVARNITLAQAPARETDFDLGRVVRRTFALLRRRWALGLFAAAILVGIPTAVSALGSAEMVGTLSTRTLWLGAVASQVGHYLLMGLMAVAAADPLREYKAPLSETLLAWAKMIPALLGLGLLTTLGVFAGYILIIIPGVILSLSWSVACPVLMIERRRIVESLGRSRDLTSGHRWSIFGLFAAYGVLWWILRLAFRAVCEAAFGRDPQVQVICDALIAWVTDLVLAVGISALYFELKTVKEGDEPHQLAAVFD